MGGFGIGYSWGAVNCTVGEIVMPEMIFLSSDGVGKENIL
jgi:hypothetical protein